MNDIINFSIASFDTSDVDGIVSNMFNDIGSVLTVSLGAVFGLIAILIALFFILRFLNRYIGASGNHYKYYKDRF